MQGMPVDPIVFETGMPWIPWSPKDRQSYRQGGRKLKGYNNDVITSEALTWLKDKRNTDKPFCLCLHPKPPHQPYKPPPKYEDFLKAVLGRPVNVRLNTGTDYKGEMMKLDEFKYLLHLYLPLYLIHIILLINCNVQFII